MKNLKKTKLLTAVVMCLLTASSTTAIAQVNLVARNGQQTTDALASEIETSALNSPSSSAVVSERVSKKFTKSFAGITNAVWTNEANGFVVRFTSNGIQNWAFLTKRGNCHTSMRYYTESDLPAAVRQQVKSTYYDYTITSVKEVYHNSKTAYLVTVADETTWKVIRVVDGEMDVLEDHVKG